MTTRNTILGALAWVFLASVLTSAALEPATAGTGENASCGCVRSLANGGATCTQLA